MKCLRCEQDNPPQARFCLGCGAGLSQRCGKCGTDVPAEARFCFSYGQAASSCRLADAALGRR
jgi:ribosomal protein L40E